VCLSELGTEWLFRMSWARTSTTSLTSLGSDCEACLPVFQYAVHPPQRSVAGSKNTWYARSMTANQFRRALADLGLTQEAAAELLGLGERTVTRPRAPPSPR
jgi:hypothetical protein